MIAIDIHNVSLTYTGRPVLWSVDAEIREGSFVAIVGPNGSGKSSLLKACAGLLPIQAGSIQYFGKNLSQSLGIFSYLPQRESVDWDFPISVLDLVLMGTYPRLGLIRSPGAKEKNIAKSCLDRVGLLDLGHRQISELSGGQQQRAFLARALAQDAKVYLLDEPFSAVDAKTEQKILEVIKELQTEGKTIVMVHHDLHSVLNSVEDVLLLNTRLVKYGPAKEVLIPQYLKMAYGGQLEVFSQVVHEVDL